MALSFEESKKLLRQQTKMAASPMTMALPANDMGIATLDITNDFEPIAAYSTWTKSDKYDWYDEYTDDKISTIDKNKNITVDASQINLSQEENSQFIPFEMPRYYDGFDLMSTELWVHYSTSDGYHGEDRVINVQYDEATIKFGWLVDGKATHIAGNLKFAIHAIGVNSKGNAYVWKTKSYDKMTVIESLCKDSTIVLDDSWVQELIERVAENVATQIGELQVADQVAAAQNAATRAEAAANSAQTTIDTALEGYYTKEEVDEAVKNVTVDLTGYATETYVQEQIDAIPDVDLSGYALKTDIPTKVSALENDAGYLTEHQSLENYATKTYVQEEIAKVDVSEQLKDYALKSELPSVEGLATEEYVQQAVAAVDVSGQLVDYAKSVDVYTKTEVDTKTSALSTSIGANTDSINGINSAITTINQTLDTLDKSPNTKYRATYGNVELDDGTTAEYMFTLYKEENGVEEVQDRFQIMGGGGSTSSVTLRIAYVEGYTTPLVSTVDEKVIVKYNFSGEDSAGDTNLDGVASWKVGNRVVATEDVATGECEFDLTDYVTIGDNKVVLTITHATGAVATKAWTVKIVDVRLESPFDDTKVNTVNEPVVFTFIPYGGVNKTVHFLLDGEEIATKTSSSAAAGLSDSYTIAAQEHGTHLFEIYMTADINDKTVESNHIVKDIIWYDETSDVPLISCVQQDFAIRQYETININYTVYDPSTETPSVSLKSTYVNKDGEVVEEYSSNIIMSSNTAVWQYKTDVIGEHTLTITCKDTVKVLKATVVELGIEVAPITAGLVFDFNPVGYSNGDENRLWSSGDISMTVSDNFDWINGGYQYDKNGDQCFCIKAGTSAEINYELFGDDAKSNGKQFKLIFRTENVSDSSTTFLSCVSDATGEGKNIGIEMKAQEATIYAKEDSLPLPYAEEEIIEFEFNITSSSETIPMVMGYEDGVSTRPMVYDATHDFQQYQGYRMPISLGSDDCDLYIYRFKVYNKSLSDKDILNNFIADARSAEEMIARYDRNQIYKEGILDPDYLAEMCPDLRIIKLEVPHFTADKDDKVYDANIQSIVECIYKNGDPIYDNWVAYDIVHSGQGTSSNNYGAAGRNLDLILKSYKDYGNSPYIILGDGSQVSKVALTRESIPVNYFNVKVNIASSENANNALLAKRYNQYNPYKRPFVREDESIIPYIKDTMEFQNCVIFLKESDPDLSTHVEFNDNNWHYYSFGNIGDSKKTDSSRLTDPDDIYECVLEVMDNTLPNSTMPTGKVDDKGAPIFPIDPSEWTAGNSAYDSLYDDWFDEKSAAKKGEGHTDDTYGWRYLYEDGTDEVNTQVKAFVEQKWKDFYEFVVTSTDEEFKANLGDWVVLDSVMYYYLFTLRYTMTDNHSKNSFWHYGKCGEVDSEGNPIRKWSLDFGYDFDTALGIDNYGRMTYRYGYEEIDYVDGTSDWVWNAPQHVFFLRLRKLFDEELCELYTELESLGAWSATGLINQFNEWQDQFPEELWRVDINRKYIRTYTGSFINGEAKPEFLKERANGRKKTQRAQFERNQEKYMSSKFGGTVASGDDVILRCSVPNTDLVVTPNFDISLTPYSHMYINVKYNTAPPVKMRAVPNTEYTIEYTGDVADIIEIYSASCLKSIGDLSACYLINGDFANAKKIRELVLGNGTDGYNNTNTMTIGLGSNELLNKLDIQNMSGLTSSLDISGLKNLKELYATGSNISGVVFADGGNIEIAEIPAVGSLLMKNLNYLTDEGMEVTSYNALTKLVAENSLLDLINIINNSPNLYQVRLTGINWSLEDTTLLERLYGLAGVTNTGGNDDQSVLAGHVHIPVVREQQFNEYKSAWPDLDIAYNTLINQFAVTFKNADGTILDVQYVDKGGRPVDPITREDSPIGTPTLASTVSTDYTFVGWDGEFITVFEPMTFTATYIETTREYTVKYMSNNIVLQETTAPYGTSVWYSGETPTYTAEESAYKYYLFDGWDASGFVNGNKTINAVYDSCEYISGYFEGKDLSTMRPVEIYAMTKLGLESDYVESKDTITVTLGSDVNYNDVESQILISEETVFNGTNKVDTGVQLFKEDRDFVLAIDHSMGTNSATGEVFAQCYSDNGMNGFRLWYNSGVKLSWGAESMTPSTVGSREMLVIRHVKGENGVHIYTSNTAAEPLYVELGATHPMVHEGTLVFGCSKGDDGFFENYAKGSVYWSKVWFADLGDETCRNIAYWPHEEMVFEMCGFRRYYLSDNASKRSSMSFLATGVLSNTMKYSSGSTSAGGWAASTLNAYLNNRIYKAFPTKWKQLMKQVKVKSSKGNMSTEVSTSDCYITIPSVYELSSSLSREPYYSEVYPAATIDYFVPVSGQSANDLRICYNSKGEAVTYWTRSPNVEYANYIYTINTTGATSGYNYPYTPFYARIMFSI